jgi:hypothetical protein
MWISWLFRGAGKVVGLDISSDDERRPSLEADPGKWASVQPV